MTRIECLAARTIHIEINERDLGGELKIRDLIEYGRAYMACPDDDDFSNVNRHGKNLPAHQKSPTAHSSCAGGREY